MQVRKQQLELDMEKETGSKQEKESVKAVYCHIMRNAGLEEAQAGIKIAGRNINNLRQADDTTLMEESEEELKSLLLKVKEGSEKNGLKLNTQETKIMASGPITSLQRDGEKCKQQQILLSQAPKSLQTVTAATKLKDAFSFEGKL